MSHQLTRFSTTVTRPRFAAIAALAALVSFTTVAAAGPTVIYVDDDAPPGDGTQWSSAFNDLQIALLAALAYPDVEEIRVAQGVYHPDHGSGDRLISFVMVSGVSLYGGYAGVTQPDPDLRDPALYTTVLSGDLNGDDSPGFLNVGDNSYRLVEASALEVPITIDGFELSGGYAHAPVPSQPRLASALYITNATVHVNDCRFVSNSSLNAAGALHVAEGGVGSFSNCSFGGNRVTSAGGRGGMAWLRGVTTFIDCVFDDNVCPGNGGAIDRASLECTLTRCVFSRNMGGAGGAIRSFSSLPLLLIDCEFYDNVADYGGAISGSAFGLYIEQGVFAGNSAQQGGAMYTTGETIVVDTLFEQNSSTQGGGALVSRSTLQLDRCEFLENHSDGAGGAIWVDPLSSDPGVLDAIDCDLIGNTSGTTGGAISASDGELWLDGCLVQGNNASIGGGGVHVDGGPATATLLECTFVENETGGAGGGLVSGYGRVDVVGCRFEANVADSSGGGVFNTGVLPLVMISTLLTGNDAPFGGGVTDEGRARLFGCTLNGNTASSSGGGVLSAGDPTLLVNCALSGNTAGERGGAVSLDVGGELEMVNATLSGNAASISGGGLHVVPTRAALVHNSILWQNQVGGLMDEAAQIDAAPADLDLSHCIVQGLTGTFGGAGNIDDDPLLRDPAGADGIAGTEDDDLRLSPGSPAIDAADNELIATDAADLDDDGSTSEPVPHDGDGHARRFDDPAVNDTGIGTAPIVDIGAYEFDGLPISWVGRPGGSWFDTASWSDGELPTAFSDIVLTSSVTIDGPGAVARSVVIQSGAALHVDGGALLVEEIVVEPGGALTLSGSASLTVTELTLASGSQLTWSSGGITIVAGGRFEQPEHLSVGCDGPATLLLEGGATLSTPMLDVCASGMLAGDGMILGDVINAGLINPGPGESVLTVVGNFQQTAGGTTRLDLTDLTVAGAHGQLVVQGFAFLEGTLQLQQAPGTQVNIGRTALLLEASLIIGAYETFITPDVSGYVLFELDQTDYAIELSIVPPTPRLFVNPAAGPGGYGTAWSSPFGDLESALASAQLLTSAEVDEIWIAAGVYVPTRRANPSVERSRTFLLVRSVDLYGGFAGRETSIEERDLESNITILSGDLAGDDGPGFQNDEENSYNVVSAFSASSLVLDGLVVTGGNASQAGSGFWARGGGVVVFATPLTLRNVTLTGNRAFWGGGGVSFDGTSTASISDCVLSGNAATRGGAIYVASLSLTITDSTVIGNSGSFGGGIASAGGWVTLHRTRWLGNSSAQDGGAVWIDQGVLDVTSSLFSGNGAAQRGGGMFSQGSTVMLQNATCAANSADLSGGGVHQETGALQIDNTILWQNAVGGVMDETAQISADSGALTVRYSCIQGLATLTGPGLIGADPLFLDAPGADGTPGTEDDDLHLSAGSPCINTGDPAVTDESGPLDLDGAERVQECRIDMGAYETAQVPPMPDCNSNGVADACDIADGTSLDADKDGIPDECACAGDTDGSGAVDVDDLVAVITSWGPCPGCPADVDGDGDVDVDDLVAIVVGWGPCG